MFVFKKKKQKSPLRTPPAVLGSPGRSVFFVFSDSTLGFLVSLKGTIGIHEALKALRGPIRASSLIRSLRAV